MKIAIVVTTYNRPDALAAVLEGFLFQSDRDFELIVADDGSTSETRDVVDQFRERASFPIEHVWQEDSGFRAARIRNLAVASTDADYIVFTDGDCIPARNFVSGHRKLAEGGCFLSGNRVLMSESFTKKVLEEKIPVHEWSMVSWIGARLSGDINRILPLVNLPDCCRKGSPEKWKGAKTCNLSAWRRDVLAVNGFDESYEGWGLEDSDFVIRLLHHGVRHKSARFSSPVFHLWHRENDRSRLEDNDRRLAGLIGSDTVRARIGIERS